MNGLRSLPVRRFQTGGSTGGFSVGPAAPSSPAIGMMGLTAPAMAVNTPVASFNVTPMDVVSLAVPALAPVNMAVNAINALAAMNTTQDPAPISNMDTMSEEAAAEAAAAEAAAAAANADTDAANVGLASMNESVAAENAAEDSSTAAVSAAVDSVDAAVGAAAAAAAADAADAAANAGIVTGKQIGRAHV